MADKLKIGDVVRLRSGGAAMTVVSVNGDRATDHAEMIGVVWFGMDGDVRHSSIPAGALAPAEGDGE